MNAALSGLQVLPGGREAGPEWVLSRPRGWRPEEGRLGTTETYGRWACLGGLWESVGEPNVKRRREQSWPKKHQDEEAAARIWGAGAWGILSGKAEVGLELRSAWSGGQSRFSRVRACGGRGGVLLSITDSRTAHPSRPEPLLLRPDPCEKRDPHTGHVLQAAHSLLNQSHGWGHLTGDLTSRGRAPPGTWT